MLESNLSAMWGFAGEWCLVGTAPFLHLMRDAWCSQNITPLVKPSVKLRGLGQSPSVAQSSIQKGRSLSGSGDFGKTERLFRSSGTLISFETEQQNTLRCG